MVIIKRFLLICQWLAVYATSIIQQALPADQRLGQMGLGGLAGRQALAQVGAQAAQLGYAGDDAGLFGEGWHWKRAIFQLCHVDRS
jgi:hypothetical protein